MTFFLKGTIKVTRRKQRGKFQLQFIINCYKVLTSNTRGNWHILPFIFFSQLSFLVLSSSLPNSFHYKLQAQQRHDFMSYTILLPVLVPCHAADEICSINKRGQCRWLQGIRPLSKVTYRMHNTAFHCNPQARASIKIIFF